MSPHKKCENDLMMASSMMTTAPQQSQPPGQSQSFAIESNEIDERFRIDTSVDRTKTFDHQIMRSEASSSSSSSSSLPSQSLLSSSPTTTQASATNIQTKLRILPQFARHQENGRDHHVTSQCTCVLDPYRAADGTSARRSFGEKSQKMKMLNNCDILRAKLTGNLSARFAVPDSFTLEYIENLSRKASGGQRGNREQPPQKSQSNLIETTWRRRRVSGSNNDNNNNLQTKVSLKIAEDSDDRLNESDAINFRLVNGTSQSQPLITCASTCAAIPLKSPDRPSSISATLGSAEEDPDHISYLERREGDFTDHRHYQPQSPISATATTTTEIRDHSSDSMSSLNRIVSPINTDVDNLKYRLSLATNSTEPNSNKTDSRLREFSSSFYRELDLRMMANQNIKIKKQNRINVSSDSSIVSSRNARSRVPSNKKAAYVDADVDSLSVAACNGDHHHRHHQQQQQKHQHHHHQHRTQSLSTNPLATLSDHTQPCNRIEMISTGDDDRLQQLKCLPTAPPPLSPLSNMHVDNDDPRIPVMLSVKSSPQSNLDGCTPLPTPSSSSAFPPPSPPPLPKFFSPSHRATKNRFAESQPIEMQQLLLLPIYCPPQPNQPQPNHHNHNHNNHTTSSVTQRITPILTPHPFIDSSNSDERQSSISNARSRSAESNSVTNNVLHANGFETAASQQSTHNCGNATAPRLTPELNWSMIEKFDRLPLVSIEHDPNLQSTAMPSPSATPDLSFVNNNNNCFGASGGGDQRLSRRRMLSEIIFKHNMNNNNNNSSKINSIDELTHLTSDNITFNDSDNGDDKATQPPLRTSRSYRVYSQPIDLMTEFSEDSSTTDSLMLPEKALYCKNINVHDNIKTFSKPKSYFSFYYDGVNGSTNTSSTSFGNRMSGNDISTEATDSSLLYDKQFDATDYDNDDDNRDDDEETISACSEILEPPSPNMQIDLTTNEFAPMISPENDMMSKEADREIEEYIRQEVEYMHRDGLEWENVNINTLIGDVLTHESQQQQQQQQQKQQLQMILKNIDATSRRGTECEPTNEKEESDYELESNGGDRNDYHHDQTFRDHPPPTTTTTTTTTEMNVFACSPQPPTCQTPPIIKDKIYSTTSGNSATNVPITQLAVHVAASPDSGYNTRSEASPAASFSWSPFSSSTIDLCSPAAPTTAITGTSGIGGGGGGCGGSSNFNVNNTGQAFDQPFRRSISSSTSSSSSSSLALSEQNFDSGNFSFIDDIFEPNIVATATSTSTTAVTASINTLNHDEIGDDLMTDIDNADDEGINMTNSIESKSVFESDSIVDEPNDEEAQKPIIDENDITGTDGKLNFREKDRKSDRNDSANLQRTALRRARRRRGAKKTPRKKQSKRIRSIQIDQREVAQSDESIHSCSEDVADDQDVCDEAEEVYEIDYMIYETGHQRDDTGKRRRKVLVKWAGYLEPTFEPVTDELRHGDEYKRFDSAMQLFREWYARRLCPTGQSGLLQYLFNMQQVARRLLGRNASGGPAAEDLAILRQFLQFTGRNASKLRYEHEYLYIYFVRRYLDALRRRFGRLPPTTEKSLTSSPTEEIVKKIENNILEAIEDDATKCGESDSKNFANQEKTAPAEEKNVIYFDGKRKQFKYLWNELREIIQYTHDMGKYLLADEEVVEDDPDHSSIQKSVLEKYQKANRERRLPINGEKCTTKAMVCDMEADAGLAKYENRKRGRRKGVAARRTSSNKLSRNNNKSPNKKVEKEKNAITTIAATTDSNRKNRNPINRRNVKVKFQIIDETDDFEDYNRIDDTIVNKPKMVKPIIDNRKIEETFSNSKSTTTSVDTTISSSSSSSSLPQEMTAKYANEVVSPSSHQIRLPEVARQFIAEQRRVGESMRALEQVAEKRSVERMMMLESASVAVESRRKTRRTSETKTKPIAEAMLSAELDTIIDFVCAHKRMQSGAEYVLVKWAGDKFSGAQWTPSTEVAKNCFEMARFRTHWKDFMETFDWQSASFIFDIVRPLLPNVNTEYLRLVQHAYLICNQELPLDLRARLFLFNLTKMCTNRWFEQHPKASRSTYSEVELEQICDILIEMKSNFAENS